MFFPDEVRISQHLTSGSFANAPITTNIIARAPLISATQYKVCTFCLSNVSKFITVLKQFGIITRIATHERRWSWSLFSRSIVIISKHICTPRLDATLLHFCSVVANSAFSSVAQPENLFSTADLSCALPERFQTVERLRLCIVVAAGALIPETGPVGPTPKGIPVKSEAGTLGFHSPRR